LRGDGPGVERASVWRGGPQSGWKARTDRLAIEAPLEIRVRGRSLAVTMRTPGEDHELAAGFLLTERIIRDRAELVDIRTCRASFEPENTLDVFLRAGVELDVARLTRHFFATSSCGQCGKATLDAVKQNFPPVTAAFQIAPRLLARLPARMRAAQRTFRRTGGLHAAAIFDRRGKLLAVREDVGRHNAVDKVIGWALLNNHLPLLDHLLLVSGRASFEIVQKALAARIPVVCAVSAASSLAVAFARANGQTLVGFLRSDTMNVYAGPERVVSK
jgi:FdhD protein